MNEFDAFRWNPTTHANQFSRRTIHDPKRAKFALECHSESAHAGKIDKKCPACQELSRKATTK